MAFNIGLTVLYYIHYSSFISTPHILFKTDLGAQYMLFLICFSYMFYCLQGLPQKIIQVQLSTGTRHISIYVIIQSIYYIKKILYIVYRLYNNVYWICVKCLCNWEGVGESKIFLSILRNGAFWHILKQLNVNTNKHKVYSILILLFTFLQLSLIHFFAGTKIKLQFKCPGNFDHENQAPWCRGIKST